MDETLIKEVHEIKAMISDLSTMLLRVLDMDIEPLSEGELTEEEREDIRRILRGEEKLLSKEEFEKYLDG